MKKFGEIKLILKVYLLVLSVFTIFRGILFFVEIDRLDFANTELMTIIQAFVMGVRFDIVISGYILFFPALALFIANISTKKSSLSLIHKIVFYWIFILFSIGFMISAADIPYFGQFFSRFSIGAFEWIENFGFVVSMILQEPKYFAIMIPMVIIIIVFYIFLKRIFNSKELIPRPNIFVNIIISILFLGIMFIGVRGRIEKKSPIRIGTAYFSDNVFLNKLGLNPVFTLMRSYLDTKDKRNSAIEIMDNAKAVSLVQKYLGIGDTEYNSPIARQVIPDSIFENKPNVIVVIMESMSAAKMKRHGNPNNITPFLDSLSNESIYFDKIYSAGKHTFNGIFGTLFSYPAIYRQHPMKKIAEYDGISSTLSKLGYSTTYFTTHDGQFDNAEGFLRANNFDKVISQKDYPSDKIMTTLGVTDDYLFEYSMPIIDELAKDEKPFFVSFMTASDHGPYFFPEYFTPKTKDVKTQIVEYADWSLQQLIKRSSTKAWFDNTIFVFIADHGASMNANYDIALNYHHTPLIIYAPKLISQKQLVSNIGGQIDVFPTIMGLINQPYINNTLGIDLLKEERPYIVINDDDKFGVLDNNYLLIYRGEKESPKMYSYVDKDRTNIYESNRLKADEMLDYAKANLQTYQYLLKSGGTKVE